MPSDQARPGDADGPDPGGLSGWGRVSPGSSGGPVEPAEASVESRAALEANRSGSFSWVGSLGQVWPHAGHSEVLALVEPAGAWRTEAPSGSRDFVSGRMAAELALAGAGRGEGRCPGGRLSVPRGVWGQPVFPAGFWGSVAHTRGLAASVVSRARPVGCDVETLMPDRRDLARTVLTGRERRWYAKKQAEFSEILKGVPVLQLGPQTRGLPLGRGATVGLGWLGILVRFCAKEAAWKVLSSVGIQETGYPVLRVFEPRDYSVRLLSSGRLEVIVVSGRLAGAALTGGWSLVASETGLDWCLAWTALPPDSPGGVPFRGRLNKTP